MVRPMNFTGEEDKTELGKDETKLGKDGLSAAAALVSCSVCSHVVLFCWGGLPGKPLVHHAATTQTFAFLWTPVCDVGGLIKLSTKTMEPDYVAPTEA